MATLAIMAIVAIPRLYPIVDFSCFAAKPDPISCVISFADELITAGATIIQYRDKISLPQKVLSAARELRRITQNRAVLIMNDYPDLCLACDANGVHLGQDDLSPAAARGIFTSSTRKGLCIGFSTHNPGQMREADAMPIDYLAVGPVFTTSTKANPDPIIGLNGVKKGAGAYLQTSGRHRRDNPWQLPPGQGSRRRFGGCNL